MKKVIISSDYVKLDRFLEDDRGEYFYVCVDVLSAAMEGFLERKRYGKVDINEGLAGLDFKKEYVDFIGRLSREK